MVKMSNTNETIKKLAENQFLANCVCVEVACAYAICSYLFLVILAARLNVSTSPINGTNTTRNVIIVIFDTLLPISSVTVS